MGAKKRVAEPSLSPPKGAKNVTTKKARVSETPATPESIALQKLVAAFDGEIGTMLPESVVHMVKSVADKCLMTPVENRDELEFTFAKVVGDAVQTGLEGLKKAHKESIAMHMARMERTFHLDARAKEMIGRALLESNQQLAYLQCDVFTITEKTSTLGWKSSQQCDAVMLAGVLKANTVLTEITMASGGDLGEIGRAHV